MVVLLFLNIFLIEDDVESAKKKIVLCLFEQMSGLKIFFHKSEVFGLGGALNMKFMKRSLLANLVIYPYLILAFQLITKRIKNYASEGVEKNFEKKILNCWQGHSLSMGGRLILLNSSISNVPLYMLSFYSLPKGMGGNWTSLDQDSCGKLILIVGNIIWSSGQWYVCPKIREA